MRRHEVFNYFDATQYLELASLSAFYAKEKAPCQSTDRQKCIKKRLPAKSHME
nr:MAG TPA: hypothetical protein [Caudoviricetes sp.]